MQIEKDKKYIIRLKTIEEYKELLKIVPWHDNSGTIGWIECTDECGFTVRVENGVIKGFDNFNNYKHIINYKDHILITMADLNNKIMKKKKIFVSIEKAIEEAKSSKKAVKKAKRRAKLSEVEINK